MSPEQWVALLGVVVLIIGAIAGLVKAIADMLIALRKRDDKPAPELGITAIPATDDIDYRAYEDMKADRDLWRARAERAEAHAERIVRRYAEHIDDDTEPIHRKETP